jgi:hypothetical protein
MTPNWSSPARQAVWDRKRLNRRCDVEGCHERHYSLGLCEAHWAQERRYQIRREQMRASLGICDICGTESPLKVDHDHVTGDVRGHLCHYCNVGLGWFRDDLARLRKAIDYLTSGAA